jgi:hypothetical protein
MLRNKQVGGRIIFVFIFRCRKRFDSMSYKHIAVYCSNRMRVLAFITTSPLHDEDAVLAFHKGLLAHPLPAPESHAVQLAGVGLLY